MLKRVIFLLSIVVLTLVMSIAINVFNGLAISNALYQETDEIHLIYHSDVDYDALIDELDEVSTTMNINISQYHFTSKTELTIVATNPTAHAAYHLTQGVFPQKKTHQFVANYPTNKSVGLIHLPSNHLKIQLFSFQQIKNIGIGNVFYVQGNKNKAALIRVFKKYGMLNIVEPTVTDTFSLNVYQLIAVGYLFLFFVLCVLTFAFLQRKGIALKKVLGYSGGLIIVESIREMILIFYSFLAAWLICFVFQPTRSFDSFLRASILCCALIFLVLFIYFIVISFVYRFSRIKETMKGFFYYRLTVFMLCAGLCLVLVLFLNHSLVLQKTIQTLQQVNRNDEQWMQTEYLYKTNVTNQLNRTDLEEENLYISQAQQFYQYVSEKTETFIIAPYNYAVLAYETDQQPVFVGAERGLAGNDYITRQGGIDITVDTNYLSRNPIQFVNKEDQNKLNEDPNTLYVLVPQKYQEFEADIQANYLSDTLFFLKEDPPNHDVDLARIKIEILYVKNNQAYFTYNMYYGSEFNQYKIIDPIAIIVNPQLMSGLFWGNILTEHGGLFFDFKQMGHDEGFRQLNSAIKAANLQRILNFTVSVFKERGEVIAKNRELLVNYMIQYFILIMLIFVLNFQVVAILYRLNFKKIFLKRMFGYAFMDQMLDVIFLPIGLEILLLGIYQGVSIVNPYNTAILLALIILNGLWFGIVYKSVTFTLMKEDIYDY